MAGAAGGTLIASLAAEGVIRMDWPMATPGWDVADAGLQMAMDAFWAKAFWWGTLSVIVAFASLVILGAAAITRVVERRFWCAASQCQVDVAFVERGLPGFLRAVGVQRCSVFNPPTNVRCQRACLDPASRTSLPRPGPLHGRTT